MLFKSSDILKHFKSSGTLKHFKEDVLIILLIIHLITVTAEICYPLECLTMETV